MYTVTVGDYHLSVNPDDSLSPNAASGFEIIGQEHMHFLYRAPDGGLWVWRIPRTRNDLFRATVTESSTQPDDRAIWAAVRRDAIAGAGMSVVCMTVIGLIDGLADVYGERFDIDRAVVALRQLKEWSDITIAEIAKQRGAAAKEV